MNFQICRMFNKWRTEQTTSINMIYGHDQKDIEQQRLLNDIPTYLAVDSIQQDK